MKIKVNYTGRYPVYCYGILTVHITRKKGKKKTYVFPHDCMKSTGSFDYRTEELFPGPWEITRWPEEFPNKLKKKVLNAVNKQIPHGCCGGCI